LCYVAVGEKISDNVQRYVSETFWLRFVQFKFKFNNYATQGLEASYKLLQYVTIGIERVQALADISLSLHYVVIATKLVH